MGRQTMMRPALLALAIMLAPSVGGLAVAQADTMKECSLKYQAAKKAGTLNGATWKSFRAAQCSSGATAATPAAGAAANTAATTAAPATVAPAAPAAPASASVGKAAPAASAPVAVGNASFPSTVNSKYASLSPGKARMQSCLDQYNANKASGANGGMKWIQKGGGYYSVCNKRLKGG